MSFMSSHPGERSHPPLADTPLIFIDLETTGTRATRDRITEIAALRVIDGQIVDRFVTLLDPGIDIPARIATLTGIDNALVTGAPGFEEVADDFERWLGDGWLVAHNARFDYSFLRNEFRRLGREFRRRVVCTLKLSRALDKSSHHHGLDALLTRYQLEPHAPRHRALGDAMTLFSVWQYWARHHYVEQIETLVLDQERRRSLPAQLDPGLLDELPARPGVYLFYGHNQLPLYVGKSVNLRSRVLSHFNNDHRNDREMKICQQTRHLEWHETAGDLGAQLLEARLVKKLSPIYNRRLRRSAGLHTWYWPTDAQAPQLAGQKMLQEEATGARYGMFRSRREATHALTGIVEQQRLCPRVMGLERGRGRCFAYQIGRCAGACCGEESLESHTARARDALESLRIRHWPWEGRVAFREAASEQDVVYHLVDQWCYLGSVENLDQAPTANDIAFDVDTYRILTRFLANEHDCVSVIPLEDQRPVGTT
ncbi:DNA polymerase-3 subunit epsilon [Kushneria avicenniae]|uniref:Excinuclease cho n=2 Tax=Kushneria avicenniae TaxID=402385 RepID=A0A1I1FLJ9_9GAMM|nr:DNA polymerase-3 subunit epsilon [Kushneria avicenniae]